MRGVLIINLGSPDSPEPDDVRRFLRSFLSDPKVVDFPRWLWLPILHGMVLRVRPKRSGELYRSIWSDQGSPLVFYTQRQRDLLAQGLADTVVRYAMTYTQPSIEESLDALVADGVDDIAVLPLFPHRAPSSTGFMIDQVHDYFSAHPDAPPYWVVPAYSAQPSYIAWYAQEIARAVRESAPERIVLSYHGVPQRRVHQPVEYRAQCQETTDALVAQLRNLGVATPVMMTFQSKFGPGRWLQPATIDTMRALPGQGVTSVVVATPGFLSDCIETSDELDHLNQEAFLHAGGRHFTRAAPVNDDPVIVRIVRELVEGNV